MKILMFNYEYPPIGGGGGVVHAQIAQGLAERHEVCVVTSSFRGLPSREERRGVEIHRVPVLGRSRKNAASTASLVTYPPSAWLWGINRSRMRDFDVVNSHFAVPTGPGSLPLAKTYGLPHVLTVHGGDLYDPSKRLSPHRIPVVRGVVRAVLRHSDVVVAQSNNTRDNARNLYGYEGAVEVIPLGVDFPTSLPAPNPETLDVPSDTHRAVTVGRLVERKGVDRLLHILARPGCDGVSLVVVGEGPERERLEDLADEIGIQSRVSFVGYVSEERKWQILISSDFYVSATLHEGFGLVFLEAMRAGLPVVTYDHGGQTDFLTDGETGYLVPAGSEDGMVSAIRRLLRKPERAGRIGRRNRELSKQFDIERCVTAYERLFERIIDRKRSTTKQGQIGSIPQR